MINATDEYMRALETPRGYVLIARNESWKQGCNLREVLRPQTTELRYKLRDLYREIHPEEYEGMKRQVLGIFSDEIYKGLRNAK